MEKNVVIGMTGGIACYKIPSLISKLRQIKINVQVIMTKNACEFITPLTIRTISNNKVVVDMFDEPKEYSTEHISIAKSADLFLIAPATANIIGKLANGICDDMLTTTVLATKSKVIIAPAMNTNMWQNKVVQRNIKTLIDDGFDIIMPADGLLACGDSGEGRLEKIEVIYNKIIDELGVK